jgi:hypothetical protein
MRDAAVTLTALAICHPPAAGALLQADHGALMAALANLHDRALPQMATALQQQGAAEACSMAAGGSGAAALVQHVQASVREQPPFLPKASFPALV